MKKTLLLFIILPQLFSARASDTLTVRQVFNFNVGDTFDYAYTINFGFSSGGGSGPFSQTYSRFVIVAKTTSPGNDTITYVRQRLYPMVASDTLLYTHLDSSIFQIFDTAGKSQYLQFDTGHYSDGRLTNSLIENVPLTYGSYTAKYGQGLGKTYSYFPSTDGSTYSISFDTTLIYYSKGTDTFGTPYYIEAGPNYAHYTPIPEECAFWNYRGYAYFYNDLYQIRTGTKVFINNHTYVELLKRSFINGTLLADSTVGFFRNDTLGRKVYFTLQPGGSESLLYDFTYTTSQAVRWNFNTVSYFDTVVSTLNTGNLQRAVWSFKTLCLCFPVPETINSANLEGIGAFNGFFHSPGFCSYTDGQPYTICSPELESFCVCGQLIYQSNSPYPKLDTLAGQCALLTGISGIGPNNAIHLYPTPTSEILHLTYPEANQHDTHLIITDLLGQQVYSSSITHTESTHDISGLPAGIYTWRLITEQGTIKTGKVLKL